MDFGIWGGLQKGETREAKSKLCIAWDQPLELSTFTEAPARKLVYVWQSKFRGHLTINQALF